ncbi:MAG: CHASE4 domain-containing protein [Roseiflexaceae bacterium]
MLLFFQLRSYVIKTLRFCLYKRLRHMSAPTEKSTPESKLLVRGAPSQTTARAGRARRRYATLRGKTLLIIVTTLIGVLVLLYLPIRLIVLGSFIALEEQLTRQDVQRALNALDDDITTLDRTTKDYASWDDSYAFVESADPEYVAQNFIDDTFTNNRLSLVVFVNDQRKVVFSKAFDLSAGQAISVSQHLQTFSADDLLLRHPDTLTGTTGILLLPEGPMLVAARPILTSLAQGPIRGTLIMGRALDAAEITRLAETMRLSLTILPFANTQLSPDMRAAGEVLSRGEQSIVRPLDEQMIAGYSLLKDVTGAPALIARVEVARAIYAQGLSSTRYFMLALLVGGLVFGVVVLALLEWAVLSRLARLHTSVQGIGTSGDHTARVTPSGSDELASLAGAINSMLGALEQSQVERTQAEQEHVQLREHIIRIQAATLAEVSTPLIPITDQVMVMPLIGAVDAQRAQQVLEALLDGIAKHGARVVILDITGVPVVDAQVAQALIRTVQAVKLLGAEVVISGIRPEVAHTMAGLGIDLGRTVTHSSLQRGIAYAVGQF